MREWPWPLRVAALAAGVSGGIGLGFLIIRGDLVAAVVATIGAVGLGLILRRVPIEDRRLLAIIISLAYGARLLVLTVLHQTLVAQGHGGHLFGDDIEYEALSNGLAQYFHGAQGTVQWFGEAYLMGVYVYLGSFVYYVFGDQVTIMKVANALLGVAVCLIVYAICRPKLGGRSAVIAAALTAFFPSLLLWSVLNLKDALALFLLLLIVWAVLLVTGGRGSWRTLLIAFVAFALIESVRRYLFLMLGVLVPVALIATPDLRFGRRMRYAIGSLAVWAFLWVAATNGYLGPIYFTDPGVREAFLEAGLLPESARPPQAPTTLEAIERQRAYSAAGARTGFTDASLSEKAPLVATDGQRFVVTDASAPTPSSPPRTIIVSPGTHLVLESSSNMSVPAGTVAVRAGDLVIFSTANPGDETPPKPLPMQQGPQNSVEVTNAADQAQNFRTAGRLLAYVPKGFAYAFAAPFPWMVASLFDRLAILEMLAWYLLVVLAAIQIWRLRRAWRTFLLLWACLAAIMSVLALTEGNVGTLFRHRAMVQPFVFILAAPMLLALGRTVRGRMRDSAR